MKVQLTRIGMGMESARRYERARPGALLHIDADDPDTQQALAWLADQGYIETVTEVDQIPGPLTFRLV